MIPADRVPPQPILPPQQPPLPVAESKIDLTDYFLPLIRLITRVTTSIEKISLSLSNRVSQVAHTVNVVFCRIIFSPDFDPYSMAFKKTLDNLEKKVPLLQERVYALEQRFNQDFSMSHDLKNLEGIAQEIKESLQQLESYLQILEKRRNPLPIQKQLTRVKNAYADLNQQIDQYCSRQIFPVFQKFLGIVNLFSKRGFNLPETIREELIQNWELLKTIFLPYANKDPRVEGTWRGIANRIISLQGAASEQLQANSTGPLHLVNIGNSCYLDSAFEALVCVDKVRQQLQRPLVRDPKDLPAYGKNLAIQREILPFFNAQKMGQNGNDNYTLMELILSLLDKGPSLHRLREAIFNSDRPQFQPQEKHAQLDAAFVMELFIDTFLPQCKFHLQQHATAEKVFPGLEFIRQQPELSTMLQIPLRANFPTIPDLLRCTLGPHIERDNQPDRIFDPKNGKPLTRKERAAAASANLPAQRLQEYCRSDYFTSLPDVMVMHFKRFVNTPPKEGDPIKRDHAGRPVFEMSKVKLPVDLPEDGIVDLTKYSDISQIGDKQTRFKIKSYVVHEGELDGGHYFSYVEIDGKYYRCDDTEPYQEIDRAEFFSRTDAYLVVMERISDQSVEPEFDIEIED